MQGLAWVAYPALPGLSTLAVASARRVNNGDAVPLRRGIALPILALLTAPPPRRGVATRRGDTAPPRHTWTELTLMM